MVKTRLLCFITINFLAEIDDFSTLGSQENELFKISSDKENEAVSQISFRKNRKLKNGLKS